MDLSVDHTASDLPLCNTLYVVVASTRTPTRPAPVGPAGSSNGKPFLPTKILYLIRACSVIVPRVAVIPRDYSFSSAPAGVPVVCVGHVVFGDLGVVVPLDELDAHAVPTRDVLPALAVVGVPPAVVDVLVLAVPTVPAVSVVLVALRMHVHVLVESNLVGALSPVKTYTHRLVVRSGCVVHDSVDLGCGLITQ